VLYAGATGNNLHTAFLCTQTNVALYSHRFQHLSGSFLFQQKYPVQSRHRKLAVAQWPFAATLLQEVL
jgi:hypothetical protein